MMILRVDGETGTLVMCEAGGKYLQDKRELKRLLWDFKKTQNYHRTEVNSHIGLFAVGHNYSKCCYKAFGADRTGNGQR